MRTVKAIIRDLETTITKQKKIIDRKREHRAFKRETERLYELDTRLYGKAKADRSREQRLLERKIDFQRRKQNKMTDEQIENEYKHREFVRLRSQWIAHYPTLVHTPYYNLFLFKLKKDLDYEGI